MSHFSVMVIGDDFETALQPYHEFECTGTDDKYVQDIDVTADLLKEFEEDTTTCFQAPDGSLHHPYEDRFYRMLTDDDKKIIGSDPIGSGCGGGLMWQSKKWDDDAHYSARVHFCPNGWAEVKIPTKDKQTFLQFAVEQYSQATYATLDLPKTHKYGYTLVDSAGNIDKVIKRTNPNKKWDFYMLGGRWNGFFKVKHGRIGVLGKKSWGVEGAEPGYCDRALKGDIDFFGMEDRAEAEAAERWTKMELATTGIIRPDFPSWDYVRDFMHPGDIEAARSTYNNHPFIKAMSKAGIWETSQYLVTKEEYLSRARLCAVVPFAFIKDGRWAEKGEMLMFGAVDNEKDETVWQTEFKKMLYDLPDDTMLNIIDCHI